MSMEPVTGTVAAYLRVSSRIQRERETIASQREAVPGHARERGWTLPEALVFADDGYSGATLDRPALEALRDAVAGGEVATAVAWSADRLSRKFAHRMLLQEEFARHGARIVLVEAPDDATPQGMLLRQMLSAISEYERTQIAERSRRGKIHRARQGSLNMITRAPYGYRLIRKTESSGARLETHEAEAAVVRRIFDLHVRDGLKMHEIPRQLDARGIRPRHAERWPTSTVAVVLRNEAHVGKAAYLKTVGTGKPARRNRTGRLKAGRVRRLTGRTARPREQWIELPVPVIVEPAAFERAQRRRAENRRFSGRKTIEPTLLQGLCVCAECGYTMGRNSGSGGRPGRRHYYRCHGIDGWRRPQGAVCDNPPVRADALDTAVWDEVLALLEHPELIQSEINRRLAAANETVSHDRRVDALRAEAAGLQRQMRRLLDAYQEGLVGLDELRERNGPLQTRQRAILSELDALQTAKLDRESRLALATTVQRFLERMRDAARSLSIVERQRIVRLLVREVRIGKDSVTICHSIPLTRVPSTVSGPQRIEPTATGSMTETGGLLVPRCGQVEQRDRGREAEQVQGALEQPRLDDVAVLHQGVGGAVQLHRPHGFAVHAQQLAQTAVPAQPAVGLALAGRVRQTPHDRPGRRRPQRAVDAKLFQQPHQPDPLHGPKPHLFHACAARPGQFHGIGVDRHAGPARPGRLAQAARQQQRRDALRLRLHRRGDIVEQPRLPVEQIVDARAQPRPGLRPGLEVPAEVQQRALAHLAAAPFAAHQPVRQVGRTVLGAAGLGAADEHAGMIRRPGEHVNTPTDDYGTTSASRPDTTPSIRDLRAKNTRICPIFHPLPA